MKTFTTLLLLLVVLIVGAAVFIWSGTYNVAATDPHTDLVRRTFETIRNQSIAEHSEQVQHPPLTDAALRQTGLRHYHAMCVMCHGAPGRERTEIAQGLNPSPQTWMRRRCKTSTRMRNSIGLSSMGLR